MVNGEAEMVLSDYLDQLLQQHLREKRIVVWYDAERAFGEFVADFTAEHCWVVSAEGSSLKARRAAEAIFRQLNHPDGGEVTQASLLIYIPSAGPHSEKAQRDDPFALFAAAGATFGTIEAEQLRALALRALPPDVHGQIQRLFAEGRPTLAMLDRLAISRAEYPLLSELLGTQAVAEMVAQLLGDPSAQTRLGVTEGAWAELLRLLQTELGLDMSVTAVAQRWNRLGQYVLFSEFAFDLPGALPPVLSHIAQAGSDVQPLIYRIVDLLRRRDDYRDAYMTLAQRVEGELHLAQAFSAATPIGRRDTFPFEERHYLRQVVSLLGTEQVEQAAKLVQERQDSLWRRKPERAQLWRIVSRCIDLLQMDTMVTATWTQHTNTLNAMVMAYIADQGWQALDRQQRLLEQSVADYPDWDDVEAAVVLARRRYRQTVEAVQARFLARVEQEGWPASALMRHTQVFERCVAPVLARRERVALVLVDALRYEMGAVLEAQLREQGETTLHAVAAALPTMTAMGMAALLPGADGQLQLRDIGDALTPHLGETRMRDISERRAYLAQQLGDRVVDVEIGSFIGMGSAQRQQVAGSADLLVIRDSRIDMLGENVTAREACRQISELVGSVVIAVKKAVQLGFRTVVIAADHGHMLLNDMDSADVISIPIGAMGGWGVAKRRCVVGQLQQSTPGTLRLDAHHMGIRGDAVDYVVPKGYKTFQAGHGYFHEGLSLQECVLPAIVLKGVDSAGLGLGLRPHVTLTSRRDMFTSRVFAIKIQYIPASLLDTQLRLHITVEDRTTHDVVGRVMECDEWDEATGAVRLAPSVEVNLPILLEHDRVGEAIEIRAVDEDTGYMYAVLTLHNRMLD